MPHSTKKKTKEEFIEKSKIKHNNRYNYSKVEYKNSQKNVVIECDKHGEFQQTPASHLFYGHGCPRCRKNSLKTTDDINPICKISYGNLYEKTLNKRNSILSAGYNLVEIWESDWKRFRNSIACDK